tara:strand:+ start:998 stop:1510 length:513 start_codon:yes stop_codon:yes gene_type:complete
MPVDFRPSEGEIVSQAFDVAQSFKANELGTVAKFRDVGSTDYGSAYFKYVKVDNGETSAPTILAGWVACYLAATGMATSTVTFDAGFDDALAIGAGVVHSAPVDNDYVWLQITGYALLTVAIANSPLAGKPVTCADDAVDGGLRVKDAAGETAIGICQDNGLGILCSFPH